MRPGVRLGIDVGSVRIGIAASDPTGLLARPVETVPRGAGDLDRIAALALDLEVVEVLVGLPVSLSGREGPAAESVRAFASEIGLRLRPLGVRLVDERNTTVDAHRALAAAGIRAKDRRAVIDQAAAVIMVQTALDAERMTGNPPGTSLQLDDGDA